MTDGERKKEVSVAFTRRYRLVESTCPVCGKTFEGTRLKRYCSDACRNLAGWRRNGAAYRERRKQGQEPTEGQDR